ncbi:MAG: 3-deoxy-D-manno-octulosonic acid transferase [Pyrinomonadaceae bacterium]|nr:3-deoxy-D-manno-octulosonic acid transferase [Pyrinomonadaceae bacterium]
MFFVYSAVYTISLIALLPYFVLNRKKYLSGFKQRLGFLPEFSSKGKPVVWIHCVSVGETNASRPLVRTIKKRYPKLLLVVSVTTKTGYDLARELYKNDAALIFYIPFDIPFIVNKVMRQIKPSLILIMETEIWFNFFRSARRNRSRVVIVNGRLSEKSAGRYALIRKTMKRVLRSVDLALMQTSKDAHRLISLGINSRKVKITGNFKFDQKVDKNELSLTAYFKERFGFNDSTPLIVAASTHTPEEKWILDAFKQMYLSGKQNLPRLVLVPRHPERFDEVGRLIEETGFSYVRRTSEFGIDDELADVVLLDTIGELRSIYPLADIVFVGGSLIPHGGQSILEPAIAGRTIVTGYSLTNFEAVANEFAAREAFVRLPELEKDIVSDRLAAKFTELLDNKELKEKLAENAFRVMKDNRGATAKTLKYLNPFLQVSGNVLHG